VVPRLKGLNRLNRLYGLNGLVYSRIRLFCKTGKERRLSVGLPVNHANHGIRIDCRRPIPFVNNQSSEGPRDILSLFGLPSAVPAQPKIPRRELLEL